MYAHFILLRSCGFFWSMIENRKQKNPLMWKKFAAETRCLTVHTGVLKKNTQPLRKSKTGIHAQSVVHCKQICQQVMSEKCWWLLNLEQIYCTVTQGMCELKCSHRLYNIILWDIVFMNNTFKYKGRRNWLCIQGKKYLAIMPHQREIPLLGTKQNQLQTLFPLRSWAVLYIDNVRKADKICCCLGFLACSKHFFVIYW